MREVVDQISEKHWRTIQNVAHQIAGRKARRSHHHYSIPRELQDRRRQSAFKDIAGSHRGEIADWIRQDGDHTEHVAHAEGGSLSNAMRHTLHVAHHIYRRDLQEHQRTGGSLLDLPKGIKRLGTMLVDTGKVLGVQADVAGDKFLHEIGIRKHLKYRSADVDQQMAFHARLNQEVYKENPGDVGTYKYLKEDSTRDYGVFHDGHKTYMVFRGTDPSKATKNNDLIDDARIATGLTGEMTTNEGAQAKLRELIQRHGDHNVNVSGYSLGGGRMLQAIQASDIYKGLGDDNYALAPGLTTNHPQFKKFATYSKMQYAYHHNDVVANGLLAHSNDQHHVFYDDANPLQGHLFLDKLASKHKVAPT